MSGEPDPEIEAEIRDREARLERRKQQIFDLERSGRYDDARRARELLAVVTESIGVTRLRMARVAQYRAEAERMRRKAETVQDEKTRQQLLASATMYEQRAESIRR